MCSCSAGCCLCSWRVSSVRLVHPLHHAACHPCLSHALRGHAAPSTFDHKRCNEVHGGVRGESFSLRALCNLSARAQLAGRRGPRRDWPPRAFIGGLVFCMGSGCRVSTPAHTSCSPSVRRPQPVQARPHHLVCLHRQLPNTSLLRPTRHIRRRVQEAPRCNTRPLHPGCDVRHPCFGPELQAMAVL